MYKKNSIQWEIYYLTFFLDVNIIIPLCFYSLDNQIVNEICDNFRKLLVPNVFYIYMCYQLSCRLSNNEIQFVHLFKWLSPKKIFYFHLCVLMHFSNLIH